ncbi:fibrillin [Euhalothece natronophila Z-M001]|uniref:Fibrillin n=1 Tax=Euhalothece natronophila Z-M001 TaxID=522448 RepID=A0A5B8NJT2_9CHRO|nr:PAP/fibrillin family protein [Euhalothece natronophila]QDZ39274.1 fibrillin [Euhalothece natronophila Z-M001]
MSHKEQLLSAIAGKNRGNLAKEADKVAVLSAIAQLETENPTPNPIERSDLLKGNWRLLYTTSKDLLRFDQFPFLQSGQIYQCIDTEENKVYNIAEIVGVPFLEGIVSVVAEFTPASEKRVNVNFKRSIVGLQRFLGYDNPSSYINKIKQGKKFIPLDFDISNPNSNAWLDITYLDDNLRIGRGNRGSVFVLTKN